MNTEGCAAADALPDDPSLLKQIVAEQQAELAAARQQIAVQQAELAAARGRIEAASASGGTAATEELALCRAIIAQQQEQLAASQRKIEALEQRLHYLLRRLYLPRSERLVDPNQRMLFEVAGQEGATADVAGQPAAAEGAAASEPAAKPKRKGHGRRRFPADAERRRIVLDVDEAEKTCPCCGQPRQVIGEAVTERLGIDPPRFYVNQYVQLKYACPCAQSGVVTAEKPIPPIERGNAEPELALRQQRSLPLLGSLRTWLDRQYAAVLPRSAMGQAIGYALGNWEALLRYAGDPEIPIDNNAVERMLRIVGIGRKNWLFLGSERGGQTAAVLLTLLSSAKRHELNTWAYLRDVLWRLADLKPGELAELLPDRWKDSRRGCPPNAR